MSKRDRRIAMPGAAQALCRQRHLAEQGRLLRSMPEFQLDDDMPESFDELLRRIDRAAARTVD